MHQTSLSIVPGPGDMTSRSAPRSVNPGVLCIPVMTSPEGPSKAIGGMLLHLEGCGARYSILVLISSGIFAKRRVNVLSITHELQHGSRA